MRQPFLDLINYDNPADPSDYTNMQDFLVNAPKTAGRFGFNPTGTFQGGQYIQSFITPYGLQMKESNFIKLFTQFGVFNYEILKRLCESPLPDASVLNLVDNAVRIQLEAEPGEMKEFTMTAVGYISDGGWRSCGCDCLIDNQFMSLEVAYLLQTTGRVKVIPLEERMCPRFGLMHELKYYPHPNPVTRQGVPITTEMIEEAHNAKYKIPITA